MTPELEKAEARERSELETLAADRTAPEHCRVEARLKLAALASFRRALTEMMVEGINPGEILHGGVEAIGFMFALTAEAVSGMTDGKFPVDEIICSTVDAIHNAAHATVRDHHKQGVVLERGPTGAHLRDADWRDQPAGGVA